MIYIYDILLNFKDILYEIFEWDKKDDLWAIRKIPLLSIKKDVFKDLYLNDFQLTDNFLDKICATCEVIDKSNPNYCFLICNDTEVLAINYKNPNNIQKSKLLFDEEKEISEINKKINDTCITKNDYVITNRSKCIRKDSIPRIYKEKMLEVEKFLDNLLNSKNKDALNYLYFDLFDVNIKDFKYAHEKIKNSLIDIKTLEKVENFMTVLTGGK